MKKIITLCLFAAFAVSGFAQQLSSTATLTQADSSSITTATVINSGNKILSVKVNNAWDVACLGVIATKVSGTMGGTVVPVASMDGITWVNIARPSVALSALRPAFSDTTTWTSSSSAQARNYVFNNSAATDGTTPVCLPYLYYGVKFVGTGTMVATIKGTAVFRHK